MNKRGKNISIRIPEELEDKIIEIAKSEMRTRNSSINWLLNYAVDNYKKPKPKVRWLYVFWKKRVPKRSQQCF